MVDWGLVAVIIAVLAYPLQVLAIPPFINLFNQSCGWLYRKIWPAAGQCTALEWTDFLNTPWHGTNLPPVQCCELASGDPRRISQLLFSGSWEPALSLLFPEPWRKALVKKKVSKPHQLSTTTQYIRTEPDVVLLYVCFSAMCTPATRGSEPNFHDRFVRLTEQNGVLVAQIRPSERNFHQYCRETCEKLRSSTQTRMEFTLFEKHEVFPNTLVICDLWDRPYIPVTKEIPYPIDSRDSWRRGGWVVAVGMSSGNAAKNSPLLTPILRNDLVRSAFRRGKDDQYMMLPQHVDSAL
ncbi:hypothetical protein M426DRAFT_242107 [Hypoxylon sp. CI-4A]|nr:hypothetical protein M426DRAFT_242107 [Hypoxylon sp. CI-4A]